ncbi:MAG: hypothetical protein KC766_03260 [Myxococcales bacterium]|nr:hypothetical protein [Myxococcales bacterium]
MAESRVTLRFEKPSFMLPGSNLVVTLDGQQVFCGDFTTGFETTLDVPPGAHLVTTQIQLGIVRNRTVEVTLEAGRHTVIILQYSRFWGNFTKKPQVFVE